ncbi:hypothetical protein BH20ACI1_BH20ACI1_02540 [soil metagenome]
MKCIEIEKNLDAFFDGELISSKEIESHLENCGSCQTSFANLQTISCTMKQNFTVSAPPLLGDKVLSAFQNYHDDKRREKVKTKQQTEKIGWFAIPRFAWATFLILFALGMISAFQIGKMSASEISVVMPEVQENKTSEQAEKTSLVKFIEVPVIQEKIVEVPVIKEKIIIKKIYVNGENTFENPRENQQSRENTALNEKKTDNKYLTPIELEGFQPVAKIKAQITKKSEVNINYEK